MTLQAPGGMGKTMHLRWFVSRLCVPLGIATAWLDFDAVVPQVALVEPWLVLLAFAEQLNTQVEGSPLTELLSQDAAGELATLWRTQSGLTPATGRYGPAGWLNEPIRLRMETALNALPGHRPIVLVVDTLEVASQRSGYPLSALIGELRELHDMCPDLRLVFAGRLNLSAQAPDHADFFDSAIPLPLEPFDYHERFDYLHTVRAFTDSAMVQVIADRSDGNPFKLSLVADIVTDAGDLSTEDFAAYKQVDLMYLLERVLLRIEEMDVRWVLRYGAIARQLDYELVDKAMAPVLAREMERTLAAGGDDPERGLPAKVAQTWQRGGAPASLAVVWDALCRYEAESSWVTVLGSGREAVLRLHVDVTQPMRRLVHDQPVFDELSERFADEYRRRAAAVKRDGRSRPGEWGRWTREELYHRLHKEPDDRSGLVRRRLDEAPRDELEGLLDDLLSHEYAVAGLFGDTDDESGPGDTRPSPTPAIVAELAMRSAWHTLTNRHTEDQAVWNRLQQTATRLQRLQSHPTAAVSSPLLVPVQAAVDMYRPFPPPGHRRQTIERWARPLRTAIHDLKGRRERIYSLVLLGALLGRSDALGAEQAFRRALTLTREETSRTNSGAVRRVSETEVLEALADHLLDEGDVVSGQEELRRAARRARGGSDESAHLRLREARFLLLAGQPNAAAARAATYTTLPDVGLDASVVCARALVAARRPAEAVELCDEALVRAEAHPALETAQTAAIDLAAVAALAHAARGEPDRALDVLERGEGAVASRAGAAARRLLAARLHVELRVQGNYNEAASTLQRSTSLVEGGRDNAALALRLYRVEWLAGTDTNPNTAVTALSELTHDLAREWAPRAHHIRAAIEALVLGHGGMSLHALTGELQHVRPAGARLALLSELTRVAALPERDGHAELRALALEAFEPRQLASVPDADDRHLMLLIGAEVERLTADSAAAAHMLGQISGGGAGRRL